MAGDRDAAPHPLLSPFPAPSLRIERAYRALWDAENGSEQRKKKLGNPANLPRPWDPATCLDEPLRRELWIWLDEVAEWINEEYVWEASGGVWIPECWPLHPHIVHELAVVADLRRRAGLTPTSELLEQWHRVVLPSFLERIRQRLKQSCDDAHQPWPARGRHVLYIGDSASQFRLDAFDSDQGALQPAIEAAGAASADGAERHVSPR